MPRWTLEQARETKAGKVFFDRQGKPALKVEYTKPAESKRKKNRIASGTKYNTTVVKQYFKECGLPEPEVEFRFHPKRKWKFDFAFPQQRVALEVEGGIFTHGAHGAISGVLRDIQKYNAAATMGWLMLRCLPVNICMQETVEMVRQTLGAARNDGEQGGSTS